MDLILARTSTSAVAGIRMSETTASKRALFLRRFDCFLSALGQSKIEGQIQLDAVEDGDLVVDDQNFGVHATNDFT